MITIGQTLRNRYQIIQHIGAGGFGDTYLAKDLDLPDQPLCVVKQVNPKVPSPETWRIVKRLFITEAEILYKLGKDHDQIPELYSYFEEPDALYLVQEFIDGLGLDSELFTGKKYNEQEIIVLLRDILEILAFVHCKGVIHRDVKPSNLIRRRKDGKLVLIDFGAVKEIRTLSTQYYGQTSLTIAIGTIGYMPTEQAIGKPRLSSDVYSVGMIGIQALTGLYPNQLPFEDLTGEINWKEYAQVSNEFTEVLTKMVRYHFKDRYESAEEALAEVASLFDRKVQTSSITPISSHQREELKKSLPPIIAHEAELSSGRKRWILPTILLTVGISMSIGLFSLVILRFLENTNIMTSASAKSNPNSERLKQVEIGVLVGFSTGITTFGLLFAEKIISKRVNRDAIQSKIRTKRDSSRRSVPPTYKNLLEGYDESLEEVKLLYRRMLDMQETHISSLKEIISNNNNHITNLIQHSDTMGGSASARAYSIHGNTNYIHFPEQETSMSVEHSDQSRNFNIGGDFTLSQSGSTFNLGDISGDVANTINQLPDEIQSDKLSFKDLLTQLQSAIEEDSELPSEDKADLLAQVKTLAGVGKIPEQEEKQGMVRRARKIFDATLKGLPDTAKIVEACGKLFPLILKALGLSV
jgi:serine/threonine protein kinase